MCVSIKYSILACQVLERVACLGVKTNRGAINLIMCANIKALLCDIENSFKVGYLSQYSDTEIELLITTG